VGGRDSSVCGAARAREPGPLTAPRTAAARAGFMYKSLDTTHRSTQPPEEYHPLETEQQSRANMSARGNLGQNAQIQDLINVRVRVRARARAWPAGPQTL
jgi:hypothetical protein